MHGKETKGGLGGAGYVTDMPRAWSQSFPLKMKSMCAASKSPTHGLSFFG